MKINSKIALLAAGVAAFLLARKKGVTGVGFIPQVIVDSVEDLQKDYGVKEITITDGANGYPRGLRPGFIGFDKFSDAEKFVSELKKLGYEDAEIRLFQRRAGWYFYQDRGWVYEPLNNAYFEDYGESEDYVEPEGDVMSYYYDVWNYVIGVAPGDYAENDEE
ncbi:hypothetical protein J6A32_10325 [Methanocorpusculum sp.]|nr:hypothetical protein [Methanocorpusculum sp.]